MFGIKTTQNYQIYEFHIKIKIEYLFLLYYYIIVDVFFLAYIRKLLYNIIEFGTRLFMYIYFFFFKNY